MASGPISIENRFELGQFASRKLMAQMLWLVVIHVTFVVSGVLMTPMDWLQARSYK
jgi:uncharacterized membrane protein YqhA